MEKQSKLRVSYRFDADIIDILKLAQKSDNPLYSNRPMTWLLQNAVRQQYSQLQPAQNGNGNE